MDQDTGKPAQERGNPPYSMTRSDTRRDVWLSSFGIVVAIFLIVGVGYAFMWTRSHMGPSEPRTDPSSVGTSGEQQPRTETPGGFDPAPDHSSTKDELKFRGGDTITDVGDVTNGSYSGRAVDLADVKVDGASGNTFWVKDGNDKVAVVASGDAPTVQAGQRVHIVGTIDGNGRDAHVRASRIDVK
jgi:hypothetical protein